MAYKISGRAITVGPTQTLAAKSGNSYTKRDLIMTVRKFDPYTGYPSDDKDNTPKFSFFGQQCQQLDNIKTGDIVVVHFDISGRSYEKDGKTEYFTEVRSFKVELSNGQGNQVAPQPFIPQAQQPYQAPSQSPQPYQPPISSNPQPFGQQEFPAPPTNIQDKGDDLPF